MNTTRLALANLRYHTKKYILLAVAIILSLVFSSGLVFLITSANATKKDLYDRDFGRQDFIIVNATDEMLREAVDKGIFLRYGKAQTLGYAFDPDLEESRGFSVGTYDEAALYEGYIYHTEGRMPEKKGEIAIENDALLRLKSSAVIGDKVTFEIKVSNGNISEYLPETVKKTYTLVGILKDKRPQMEYATDASYAKHIPAAVVSNEETISAGGKPLNVFYASCKGNEEEKWEAQNSFYNDIIAGINSNVQVLNTVWRWSNNSTLATLAENMTLLGMLFAILGIASLVGIINAFTSILEDRKQQMGILRSIGASKRQLVFIYAKETAVIAVIALIPSMLVSYFGTKIIVSNMSEHAIFIPQISVLLISAAVGVLAVCLVSLIPLSFAVRISPMQAVRNIEKTRKLNRKKIKSQKSFKVPNLLASRTLIFGKGRLVLISLILTIMICMTSLSFGIFSDEYINILNQYSYDYAVMKYNYFMFNGINFDSPDTKGITANEANEILSCRYVKSVAGYQSFQIHILKDSLTDYDKIVSFEKESRDGYLYENDFTEVTPENYLEVLMDKYKYTDFDDIPGFLKEKTGKAYSIPSSMYSVDSAVLSGATVIDGKIDLEKIASGEEVVVRVSPKIGYYMQKEAFPDGDFYFFMANDIEDGKKSNTFMDPKMKLLGTAECSLKAGDIIDLAEITIKKDHFSPNSGEGKPVAEEGYDINKEGKLSPKTVKVGAVISDQNLGSSCWLSNYSIITSHNGLSTIFPQLTASGMNFETLEIKLKDEEITPEVNEIMMEVISQATGLNSTGGDFNIESIPEYKANAQRQQKTALFIGSGIILLLFFICVSLISNSFSIRIRHSSAQLGTLRAVGASEQDLRMSFILQLRTILLTGIISGFVISLLLFFGSNAYTKFLFGEVFFKKLAIWQPILLVVALTIVCIISLSIQIRKMAKFSIVENIRAS